MKRNFIISICATVIVWVFAISSAGQELGKRFEIKLGQEVTVKDSGLTIKFLSFNDSRCPKGAICEWEGDAEVTLQVFQTSFSPKTISLHTNWRYPRQATYSDFIVQLVDLSPHPKVNEHIKPEDHVATLIVAKGEDNTIRRSQ